MDEGCACWAVQPIITVDEVYDWGILQKMNKVGQLKICC